MRTRSSIRNKINIITLGCSKNIYDSEVLMGQLKANNKNVVHEKGIDLGSSDIKMIKKLNVGILGGSEVSPYNYGEIWYFFEKQVAHRVYPGNSIKNRTHA